MKKVIYIYWAQKFINAPYIVKKCLLSWKIKNPTWKIIELDDDNLSEYINIEEEIPNIQKKNIKTAAYSDIVRIFLLEKYGGCWCDATTFCNQSLDIWLNKNTLTGFFGFELNPPHPQKKRVLISSWFLYSEENNYIIKKWKEKTILYWKNHNDADRYRWFHNLFSNLYNTDNKFKELWDLTPKISSAMNAGPRYLRIKLLNKLSDKVKNHINEIKTPLYKLTYKYNIKKYNEECNLSYLLNTINLKFIHIGKCGGTTITYNIKELEEYHLRRNYKNNELYIIWIRNPLKRFVSAFNYINSIIHTDTNNLNSNNLTLDNCLAPVKIKCKMMNKYCYTKRFDFLISCFKTANELAESITSEDIEKKQLALELMNCKREHIFKGIGWYLKNGKFIEKNHNKIIFIGTCENMTHDITRLSNLLNIKIDNKKYHMRKNTNSDKFLSSKAIKNILNFYKDTDYKALQKLVEYNFITKDLFEKYHHYNI